MNPARYCARCHAELAASGSGAGHCPRCLLALGLDAEAPGVVLASSAGGGSAAAGGDLPDGGWSLTGRRLGCYDVRELLGGGGMGRVYAAHDSRLGRTVALKVLPPELAADPERLARFRREARALAALSHPGIVTIHAIEEIGELHFLIMERVVGQTLAELVPASGLPCDRVLGLALPLAEALGAAHGAGVVHRDLKPANVMVDGSGRVKLLDFGLARQDEAAGADDGAQDPSLTRHGLILGTLPYLSPEQVQGRRGDRLSDLFSLGVLLFEMATGRRPFRGETAPELFASILRDEAPRLRDLRPEAPAALDDLVARCLEKDPLRRPRSTDDVIAGLRRAAGGGASDRQVPAPSDAQGAAAPAPLSGSDPFLAPPAGVPPPVGREDELARLRAWLDEALAGSRRTVFVTGAPGLGKTALVEAFVRDARRRRHGLWVGHGQCLERLGPGEAYMPVLEALGRMCRGDEGGALVTLLARLAPSWLAQMPALVSDAELAALERRSLGATHERMLREMVEALEALSRERPVVLVLEDLHWSDPSTIDLVAWLARRPDPARLLLVCTFRPEEDHRAAHPLRRAWQELLSRAGRQCFELPLGLLEDEAVAAYLEGRFPGAELPARLPELIRRHTDGNPLFLEAVTGSWVERGLAAEADGRWRLEADSEAYWEEVPPTLRKMIERQLEALDPGACELLEAAAVAGCRFAAAAVAPALGASDEETERGCERLARSSRFLRARGSEEWPDGTISGRFAFVHDLYQQVLYERLPAARRARLHRQVGERLEEAHRRDPRERAAELAVHFLHGRDARRAVEYLRHAAEHALRRSAYQEALDHLTRAVELLPRLPEGDERLRAELALQARLAPTRTAIEGWSSAGVERAYLRALELGEQLGDRASLSPVLYGIATMWELRGQYQQSEALLQERLGLTACVPTQGTGPAADTELLESRELLACSTFHQGRFSEALEHAEKGIGLFVPESHRWLSAQENLGVSCHDWAALSLWFLGFPDRAAAEALRALALAEELDHPYTQTHAHAQAATVFQCRREVGSAREHAEAALALSVAHGFPFRIATGEVLLGWCLAMSGTPEEGVPRITKGLAIYRQIGAEMDRPYYLALLAEAQAAAGRDEEALETLAQAAASAPVRRGFFYEPEFHRLRGEILRRRATVDARQQAEDALQEAAAVARHQGSRSLELRAAVELADLLGSRGNGAAARHRVSELYGGFDEGHATVDLQRARELIARGESAP